MPITISPLDRVLMLKVESVSSGGTEEDTVPTEINVEEDYAGMKGVSYEGRDDTFTDRDPVTGEIRFVDPVNGAHIISDFLAGGGLTPTTHRALNQIVHNVSETSFYEINRDGNQKVSSEIFWVDNSKLMKIREILYTRSGSNVSSYIVKQYDNLGSLVETETHTINRSGGKIVSEDIVLS